MSEQARSATEGDRRRRLTAGQRRLVVTWIVLGVSAVLLLGLAGVVLYARGGGPLPAWAGFLRPADRSVLEPSGPAEVVLRTLRLAGYRRAVVGEKDGTVVVRIEVPRLSGAADVALTWQTAMAAAQAAYPDARRIVAQVFSPQQALVEVSASADDVADAVRSDDAAALRKAATVRYLSEVGGG